jgi:hypothetical protein
MKPLIVLLSCLTCIQLFACSNKEMTISPGNVSNTDAMKLKITIGSKTFTATLNNNETATAFKAMLPMEISMKELNGNEKYFDLPNKLPVNASNPNTIQAGDLMLYGSSTLVLFYQTFSTSYAYTRLGRIDNLTGLAAALGSGNVRLKFELE